MAKGCGNNSVEFWYFGRGNITQVDIPITYNTGTAYQGGSTNIIGVGTTWTADMVGNSFDFISADGTVTPAGKITSRASNTSIFVTKAQTVASSGSPISYVIKNRGQYPLGEPVSLTLSNVGQGKGAAFKVWLRPIAGSIPLVSELERIDVLSGGLGYGTHRTGGANTFDSPPIPILGGSATGGGTLTHGKVEIPTAGVQTSDAWHQAKTFDSTNAVINTEIEYNFNDVNMATITLINRSPDVSSLFSDFDASGQFTDFFREGQELLLRDHTTHVILFRGLIQELEDTYEMGLGQVIRIIASDHMREWDDVPAEVLSPHYTSLDIDLPAAKIYSIIEERLRPFKNLNGGERRIAFGEGPLYRMNSTPAGSAFPTAGQEGKIAAKRGHGHQVGRRFAFENSWFPRDTAHFKTAASYGADGEPVINERATIPQTVFKKGKRNVLSLIQTLASQEKQAGYWDGGATDYIRLSSGDEWAFHLTPNILTPTPEILGTSVATDGNNDTWITNNTRTGTTVSASSGVNYASISLTDALNGRGFFPSDVGKDFTVGGTTEQIIDVSGTTYAGVNTRVSLTGNTNWGANAAFSIAESLPSIPQFNYFEVGSRPAFAFDPSTDTKGVVIGEISDARNHSVTMIRPTQPISEQGISKLRATTSQQNAQLVTQPSLEGTANGTAQTRINGTYGIKNILIWEIKLSSATQFQYRQGTIGTDLEDITWSNAATIQADTWFNLLYNVQFKFENASGHTTNDVYRFTSYPQFDNTRAFRIIQAGASWSKQNHEKYSTALVYYDAEASSEENYGTSNQIRMDLIYGWNVQNRSWIWHDSANSETETSNFRVRVHQGDADDAHTTLPVVGSEDECINFSNDTTPVSTYGDVGEGGNAFFTPGTFDNILSNRFTVGKSEWGATETIGSDTVYKFRDFMYKGKHLTEGEWDFFNIGDMKASRGDAASEYVDVYRGRYTTAVLGDGIDSNKQQIEWRRWDSGKRVAAIQWIDATPAPFKEGQVENYVHKASGGGELTFPFGAGTDEKDMVRALVSFDGGTNEENWPTTNTYDDKGIAQSVGNWKDFPFVRLVGETTGTKIDFNADIATRANSPSWMGRPMDTWKIIKPLRRTYTKDNSPDEIRHDISDNLHKRVSDMRVGRFTISKAPYYWLEAQVDGFTESGSNNYGDDTIDPGGATSNPNTTTTIRFKLQKLGATTGLSYYNPLQYGLMIGNVVRFYNHKIDSGGAAESQDFSDSNEFCYGIITDIQAITTAPSGGSEYPQNEDTYDMCGWIEVQLTHAYRKTGTEDASVIATNLDGTNYSTNNKVTYKKVVAASGATYSEPNLAAIDGGAVGSNSGRDSIYKDGNAQTNPTYTGPTRVKVYNMLYPGYSVRVEDRANGISAKHLIQGMLFNSRSGVLKTELVTQGKKADQDIRKWGTTPIHLTSTVTEKLVGIIKRADTVSASGIGNTILNPDNETPGGNYFWFGNIGASTASPITDYSSGDFIE